MSDQHIYPSLITCNMMHVVLTVRNGDTFENQSKILGYGNQWKIACTPNLSPSHYQKC